MKKMIYIFTLFFFVSTVFGQNEDRKPNFENKQPLKIFLTSPIKKITIKSFVQGCFNPENDEIIIYEKLSDSILVVTNFEKTIKEEVFTYHNEVNGSLLSRILATINLNPSHEFTLSDFQIVQDDKEKYLVLSEERINENKKMGNIFNKDFFNSIPLIIDTLDNTIISNIIGEQQEEGVCSVSHVFSIQIVNENNEILNVSKSYCMEQIISIRRFYMNKMPWLLPWTFEFNGTNFNCYNIDFSRYISSCIPSDFSGKETIENSELIMKIADYLWYKQKNP